MFSVPLLSVQGLTVSKSDGGEETSSCSVSQSETHSQDSDPDRTLILEEAEEEGESVSLVTLRPLYDL